MCNRFRSIREWSDIPRRYHSGPRLNFEFNPNVAPTELVPVLVAEEGIVLARFGINRLGSGDRPRPPLLNVRTDGMRKGQFRKHLKERRCVVPCEGSIQRLRRLEAQGVTLARGTQAGDRPTMVDSDQSRRTRLERPGKQERAAPSRGPMPATGAGASRLTVTMFSPPAGRVAG